MEQIVNEERVGVLSMQRSKNQTSVKEGLLNIIGYKEFSDNVEMFGEQSLLRSTKCCGTWTC